MLPHRVSFPTAVLRLNARSIGVLSALGAVAVTRPASAQLPDAPEMNDRFGSALAAGDFNGDAIGDLAIGVPWESIVIMELFQTTTHPGAGAVHVLYGVPGTGSSGGLSLAGTEFWYQRSHPHAIPGIAAGNALGSALSSGDYNGDGFDDLAIGIPGQSFPGLSGAGAVQVLYGSSGGLHAFTSQFWSQGAQGLSETAESGDAFGSALTTGDFDGDGFDDLAIGVPAEDIKAVVDAGVVQVIRGSSAGLTATDSSFWHEGGGLLLDGPETGDKFGLALAAGDFDADGFDDLAVGVPMEGIVHPKDGAVEVIYGTSTGLSPFANQFWHQDSIDIEGVTEQDDMFGTALAAGDYNADGFDDLAIGVPNETTSGIRGGGVNLLLGSFARLDSVNDQLVTEDTDPLIDSVEPGDRFGAALTTWDFGANGVDDLAIGVPGESIGSVAGAGAVELVEFRPTGEAAGSLFMTAGTTFFFDTPETNDGLGSALAVGDFNGDGREDFAAGVPFKNRGKIQDSGIVDTAYQFVPKTELWRQGN